MTVVTTDHLGKIFSSLRNRTEFLPLVLIYFKCSLKFYGFTKNIRRCFRYGVWITWSLLNIKSGWFGFLVLREKITFSASIEGLVFKLLSFDKPSFLSEASRYLNHLLMYFCHDKPEKEKCHLQKYWDLMITQLINHSYRVKPTKGQVLNLRRIQNSPQPMQMLVCFRATLWCLPTRKSLVGFSKFPYILFCISFNRSNVN